eukprot:3381273-Pleurochrysis_carterae.AAC.3
MRLIKYLTNTNKLLPYSPAKKHHAARRSGRHRHRGRSGQARGRQIKLILVPADTSASGFLDVEISERNTDPHALTEADRADVTTAP